MNYICRLLGLALTVLAVSTAVAQPYYFRHYQVDNGLSNNTVYCSLQDKTGFLWFGTKEGLNRFDGYRFKNFRLGNAAARNLQRDFIYCLYTDEKGLLWVGTQNGVYTFNATQERLEPFIDTLNEIDAILKDRQGRLWFLSNATIYRYDFATRVLKSFPPAKYFGASAMCMDEEGTLWFGTVTGQLQQYDAATETFRRYDLFSHSTQMATCFVEKLYANGNGGLFVGTTCQGIKLFNRNSGTYEDILMYSDDKTTIYVRDILKYAENEYWFASESGIFVWNSVTKQSVNLKKTVLDPYSLSDNAVYTLCRDQEGGMWAGTFFGGLNYYPRQYTPFQKYYPDRTSHTIGGGAVREICEDSLGNMWIGTEDAGLSKMHKATGAITHFKPTGKPGDLAYHNVHGLMVLGDRLWIGMLDHGLDVLDIRSGKVIKRYAAGPGKYQFKNDFIVSFLHTRAGEVFVGTGTGVYRYRAATDDFECIQEFPAGEFISCLAEDHTGTIWAGSRRHGAMFYNPATRQSGFYTNNPNDNNSLSMKDINAIYEDSEYNLWVATEGGGVCKLNADRTKLVRYTTQNGLPSNFTFKVVEDNNHKLWITTSKGLVRLNANTGHIDLYTKAHGLLYDQFNYNSGYKDADGRLYFGCIKGMISFVPENFTEANFVPPVYITGFQVHNKELVINKDSSPLKQSILFTRQITLPYTDASVSIDFAALGFATPDITRYRYIMEGLDKEWTQLGANRKVYFTNLAPGSYTFKVAAAANTRWSSEKTLKIVILPPFWATSWARLIYALMIVAVCWWLVRNYHKRQKVKKEKEIYEAKIDFFTNVAHEIRTPLTLIKGPVENLSEQVEELPQIKKDVLMMERNTNRLMTLVTQILDFRQTEAKGFSLDLNKVNIGELLQDVYVNFQPLANKKNLSYSIELPPSPVLAVADEDALQKIFSNLISNAVKYAAENVVIRLHPVKKDDTLLTVDVCNDGLVIPAAMKERIFEPFFRLKETAKQKGTGIGLSLARSLAQLHEGALFLDTRFTTVNTFVLQLPLEPGKAVGKKKKRLL